MWGEKQFILVTMNTSFLSRIFAFSAACLAGVVIAGSTKTNLTISSNTPTMVLTDRIANISIRYSAFIYNAGPTDAKVDRTSAGCSNGLPLPVGSSWYADPPTRVSEQNMHDSSPVWIYATGTTAVVVGEETR